MNRRGQVEIIQETNPESSSIYTKLFFGLIVLFIIAVGIWYFGFYHNNPNPLVTPITPVKNITNSSSSKFLGSPFGTLPGGDSYNQFGAMLDDLGIKTVRYGGIQGVTYWALEKPENMPPGYPPELLGWDHLDKLYRDTNNAGIEMSVIINSDEVPSENSNESSPTLTSFKGDFTPHATNLTFQQYGDFVKKAVIRYPQVTYWEIDNEPDILPKYEPNFLWKGDLTLTDDYAHTVKTAYQAIKSVNPKAKVALGAVCTNVDYFEPVLEELANLSDRPGEKFFDVFNFHLYGDYREYGQKSYNKNNGMPPAMNLPRIKELLAKYNYSGIEIIMTEGGTVSGGNGPDGQTESQQAGNLVKRYIYLTSQGVTRHYWYDLNENLRPEAPLDGPTNALVLMSEGTANKKLAYYAYKLMTQKLEGSDWSNVKEIYNKDSVYAYKLTKNGKSIYVLWWDYFDDASYISGNMKTVQMSDLGISGSVKLTEGVPKYSTGSEVSDFSSAFNIKTISGSVSLGENPVYLE